MIWFALLLQLSNSGLGEKIFAQSCSVGYCHGAAGAAARGPRLRGRTFDKDYLFGVIRNGIPESAMPAWKDRLKDDQIWAVVGYVQSLSSASAEATRVVSAAPAAPAREEKFTGSPAAARGKELFFEPDRCASCHSMDELSRVPADKLIPAIEATSSTRVRTVKLSDGESFPALVSPEAGGFVRALDLTEPPPVSRTLDKGEIESIGPAKWSHKAALPDYTREQFADIAAYIEWAAAKK